MDATPEERWSPLPEWEGLYEISDLGRVRTVPRIVKSGRSGWRQVPSRIRRLGKHSFGYSLVVMTAPGRQRVTKMLHSLVLEAFVGPRPPGAVACHNDGDPGNNRLDNLRWDTQSSNLLDAVAHGKHKFASATHCKNGHAFSAENCYIAGPPGRQYRLCRKCRNERVRKCRPPKKKESDIQA
jgi:hypothetical protein